MRLIEAKLKELEDKLENGTGASVTRTNRDFLLGFNLGVEIARKEFLEILEFIINDEVRIRKGRHENRDKHIDRFGNHIFSRVKQKLGDKT